VNGKRRRIFHHCTQAARSWLIEPVENSQENDDRQLYMRLPAEYRAVSEQRSEQLMRLEPVMRTRLVQGDTYTAEHIDEGDHRV